MLLRVDSPKYKSVEKIPTYPSFTIQPQHHFPLSTLIRSLLNMASHPIKTIFIIGGTGAQGLPVIQALSPTYNLRVLTRDLASARAQSLLAIPNVTLQEGTFADEAVLRKGFTGVEGAFVNIDGFNTGEKNELYWAIRTYEIALQSGVKFFVYGNLEYISKESGYDDRFRAGHYDGKGRVGEWILFQNLTNRQKMASALFTTGPYIEMTISSKTLMSPTVENGVATWTAPMGNGKFAPVALDDVGYYVKWLFEHRERADGLDLKVSIDNLGFGELVEAFERVTGKPARFVDVSLEEFWSEPGRKAWGEQSAGYNAGEGSMSVKDNFTGGVSFPFFFSFPYFSPSPFLLYYYWS